MFTPAEIPSSGSFLRSQFADAAAFDSKKFKTSIHNKVSEMRHIAFSAIFELGISLTVGALTVLSFTAVQIFIPYFIAGIGLFSTIIIVVRVFQKAKRTHNYEAALDQSPFRSENRCIIDEISVILSSKQQFDSDTIPPEKDNEENYALLIETLFKNEKIHEDAKAKFTEYIKDCNSTIEYILQGRPAIIDETISELSQRNTWSKIFSLFTKICSFGFSFAPKSNSTPKRLLSNSRDLLGYQKMFVGWTNISYNLHRCSLREQEILKLKDRYGIIEELAHRSGESYELHGYFVSHLKPLKYNIEQLEKINHEKKCKQFQSTLESTVGTAETVTDLVTNFFDSQNHSNYYKVAQGTLSGLAAFGNALSIGFQSEKMIAMMKEALNCSKKIKSLLQWQEKHRVFLDGVLPAPHDPAWDEWNQKWKPNKVSDQDYVTAIKGISDIVSAKIDVLRKNRRNAKISSWTKLLKFGLTLLKSVIIIKEIVILGGKNLVPGTRLAFSILNLVFTISSLLFQLGKFGYKVYINRHAIRYYRGLMRHYSHFQDYQKTIDAKQMALSNLENVPPTSESPAKIAQLREELRQLSKREIQIKDEFNRLHLIDKQNRLKDSFYSFTDSQLEEFLNEKLNSWLFKPDKTNTDQVDYRYKMVKDEMANFGLITENLHSKEILKFVKEKS